MATVSAFGDPIIDDEPTPVATAASVATLAFGDPISAPVGGMAEVLAAAQPQPQLPNRTAGQWATDVGGSVGRGAYSLFDALAGLGDIATAGAATPWLAQHGLDSKAARAQLDAEMSPQARAQRDEVANAKGFGPTIAAMARNPAYVGGQVIESVPTMVVGGVAGKGAALGARALGLNAGRAALVGAGTGEGLAAAGQQAAQTVQQTGDLTPGQTGLALLSGGLTGLLGAAGARIGRKLGALDIDAQLAGVNGVDVAKGLVNRALTGTGIESLEELSQSAQQQVLTNLATDRPVMEGVGNAAGQGAVLGGAMGGTASLRRPNMITPQQVQQPAQQQQGQAAPAFNPQAMPSPAPTVNAPANAPQAPTPQSAPIPFAKSADISPLLDRLGVQGEQRAQTMDLLKPIELNVEDARRGVIPNAERDRLAALIGLQGTDAQVFNRKIGQALNAEQTVALTTHVQDNLKDVLDLQQKIASGQATDVDRAAFVQSLGQMRSTFADLAGARAEAGRALSAYRRQALDYRQAQAVLESVGGLQGADDAATALGKAIQSGGIANASRLIAQPESKMNRLFGYYYRAALLSGVRTHAVNITSNTLTLGNEIIERGIAAGIGGAKRALTGGKSGQTVFAEPLDLLMGMAKGSAKAGAAGYNAFKTGDSPMLGGGKQETGAIGNNMNAPRPSGVLGTAGWAADKLAGVPYRALGAEDAFFATLNYEGELRTLALQQALAEKKLGQLPAGAKLSQRIEQLVQDPTSAMIESAGEHARTQTFNNRAGTFAQAIMSAKAKQPWLNLIVPFVRTPANIVKFGLKRTPAAPLFQDVRADLKAGGAKQERAIARMLWGSSVMVVAGMAANAGYVTGAGPDDKKEKAALLASGWRPYSIKVGDTYHEYNRLDPFSQWLGLAADMATMDYQHKGAGDIAANVLGSVVNNTVNKTYMQGLSNFVEFLQDPKRNGPWYLRQMGGTMAQPFTLLSNIASEQDPSARETNSLLDAIKYRVPGMRTDLPEKLDVFGAPVPNRTYPGGPFSIAAPVAQSQQTTDPLRLEAGRLGWSPSAFQKDVTIKGKKTAFSPEQYRELAELTGQLTHRGAARLMQSSAWNAMDDDARRDALDDIAKKSRTAVRLAAIPFISTGNRSAINKLRSAVQQESKQ